VSSRVTAAVERVLDVRRDADAVFYCTAATMRRYVGSGERPDADDIEHLARFCLSGLGLSRRKAR
jgi:hypothetical protein